MTIGDQTRPPAGEAVRLASGLRRILAPNPSPMTFRGTNTYLLGEGRVAVIDPGPADPAHLRAILRALGPGERVSHVLVTHAHLDHSALAPALAAETGAKVFAFGPPEAGQSAVMARLRARGLAGGGEGVDRDFVPDVALEHGAEIVGQSWRLRALHTPGHMANHMCFDADGTVFTGDHVMGWASSVVSPPDGDVAQFMASCALLARLPARLFLPGHGAPVTEPRARIEWLMAHRRARESEILAALGPRPATLEKLTREIYTGLDEALIPMAARNVFAHLVDLVERGLAAAEPELSPEAKFCAR